MKIIHTQKEKKKERSLTKKEAGFVGDYLKTGNGVQSALKNYDTKSYKTASTIATANLEKPRIREIIKSFAEKIPEDLLLERHLGLLNAFVLDRMTFPPEEIKEKKGVKGRKQSEELTDADIKELLTGVGCVIKQIVHGKQKRDVYFWAPDNNSRKDALEKAFKLKGLYDVEPPVVDKGVDPRLESMRTLIEMLKDKHKEEEQKTMLVL